MTFRSSIQAFLILALSALAASASTWDETQLQLLQQYSTPLRWYNVEGGPYWVAGPKPHQPFGRRLHLIGLQPGEAVILHAPANTWVRLTGDAEKLNPAALEISLSTDSRAFASVTAIQTTNAGSLLVALPQDRPALVRIARPRDSGSKVIFAAFVSSEQPFPDLAPYRDKISLPGKSVRLRREDESVAQSVWPVKPEQGIDIPIEGPTRLQVIARLPWPVDEPLREQLLVLQLGLDAAAPRPVLLHPELDARRRTRVSHSTELVSYPMTSFVDVPDGRHILHLRPDASIYLTVYRQPLPDYLLPWLNAPRTNALAALRSSLKSSSNEDPTVFQFPPRFSSVHAFANQEQEAWWTATDNGPRDAGAQAAEWLNHVAQTRRDYPEARQSATELWQQRTFYREVLPALQADEGSWQRLLFSQNRLMELFAPQRPVAVFNPTLEQARELFADGQFARMPVGPSTGLVYFLPQRSYESWLRIAAVVPGEKAAHFFVQFDREPPVKVTLEAKSILPTDSLEPSRAFGTLEVLEQQVHLPKNQSLEPRLDEFDVPLPISTPGVVELPLPQTVRQVRIYGDPSASGVIASVAYRASKSFELSEANYLSLLNRPHPEEVLKLTASDVDRQLRNHFLPLIRLLQSHSADFAASIDLNTPAPTKTLSSEDAAKLRESALAMEKDGQLIEALEVWNRLFLEGADRLGAALSIMHLLQKLDEDFLATQYARYALLTAPADQPPAPAVTLLERDARDADDPEQLEQLRAFLYLRCPCPSHLTGLIDAFGLNSRDDMVLFTGLLLPREQRPHELMLTSALHLNWWQSFDKLVEELPAAEAKCFWRAQKQLAFYHFDEAERELTQAGSQGAEMLRALQEGTRIRERLASANLAERLDAVVAWEDWQSHQPGPKAWRESEDVQNQCSGAELVFNREQNRFAHFLRAEPGKPVTLRFMGPIRLQIEARPLLEVPFAKPIDDWVEIVEAPVTNRVPVFQCVPSPSLQLVSTTNALAGVKTTANLEWPAGWHEVTIRLAQGPGLIRVLQERTELPTRILPTINIDRVNLVLGAGRRSVSAEHKRIPEEHERWWVSPEQTRVSERNETNAPRHSVESVRDDQKLRLALRIESPAVPAFNQNSPEFQTLPIAEQWQAISRWGSLNAFTRWSELPETEQVNYLLATHRVRELLDLNVPHDFRERLVALLRVAESFPAWRHEAQCLGESLALGTNCPPGSKKIVLRLTEDLTWAPLPISPVSAGIRPVDVRADLAQDPSSRIRRALAPPTATNQFTVGAQSAFTASMLLQHSATLDVKADLARAGFSPWTPLNLSMQIDERDIQHFALTPPQFGAGTNFNLDEGTHLVRIWIEDPVVNEVVRVTFAGRADDATNSIWTTPVSDAATEKRFFHGATAAQPLRFPWRGPALLRVDEWLDGRFTSQFRLIQSGDQNVEIGPSTGHNESWYRIFVRALQETNQPESRSTWTMRQLQDVPPPKLPLPESVAPSQAEVTDYYKLGGQEDGTWTADVMWVHRRPFELDFQQRGVVNEYAEVNGFYRKQTADEAVWLTTEVLGRVHRPGDLTFGLGEKVEGRPRFSMWEWTWAGQAFVGSTGPDQQDVQGALDTALEIGPRYHLNRELDVKPYVGGFAQYLTLSQSRAATYTYVDHDLFTRFRSEHLWGWNAGVLFEYRPWLDSIVRGRADAASNENGTPDHWGTQIFVEQLFGPVRAEVGYRFTQFLADDDRPSTTLRHSVGGGIFAEHWINGRHRVELGMQYRHDWPNSGDSYFVVFRWDFSQGRGYRDYGPNEMEFRELRRRNIPAADNNILNLGPTGAALP
jgi:hypothetical protein